MNISLNILTFFLFFQLVKSDIFRALVDLEDILYTESILIKTLDKYLQSEQQRLDLLEKYKEVYQKQNEKAFHDVETYIANPINAYLLVKRLTADWKEVESLVNINFRADFIGNVSWYREYLKFPTDEDLKGAAAALLRLQDTYNLNSSSLARGELNGVKYSSELSAADCFQLGQQTYNNGDFNYTALWMREADARLGSESNQTIDKTDILEYLALSTYKQGNIPLALELTNELLQIFPTHSRSLGNKIYYEKEIEKLKVAERKGDALTSDPIAIEQPIIADEGLKIYKELCRGETKLPVELSSKLKCRYLNNNNPFLLIAPFKIEEAYLDPKILIFYDVMSDNEIETIKDLSISRFESSRNRNHTTGANDLVSFRVSKHAWLTTHDHKHISDVCKRVQDMTGLTLKTAELNFLSEFEYSMTRNYTTGRDNLVTYRVSKNAWLKTHDHKHVSDVNKRVQDMTGLTVATAEPFQVVNYGIGGHYIPHFDFATKEFIKNFKTAYPTLGTGNRIATVLFYLSDVSQGGATVLPNIKVSLWPKKGAAAFWFNLHSSGEGNPNTLHGGCPVLTGSKWICTKWFHELGQEFLRPCGLKPPPPEMTI